MRRVDIALERAPEVSRLRQAADVARARAEEAKAVWVFLTTGADEFGRAEFSRDYDPHHDLIPYDEANPQNPYMYEGTGIGALYEIPGGERHLWQLAGWNLRKETK